MKPYYQDSAVTIYHGDCRDIFVWVSADLILTDPPYGVGGGSGTIGKTRSHKSSYGEFEDTLSNVIVSIVPRFKQIVERFPRAIITPGPLAMCYYPQPDSFGCLLQSRTSGMQKWGWCDAQPIFYYGRDPRVGKTISKCSFDNNQRPEDNGHPCPKPVRAWSHLILKGSLDNETILDPFMGSGTTLRAAKDLGRKAIGIEIEEKYCEIAAKRMAQEVFQF
jgi:DNA modification methylase